MVTVEPVSSEIDIEARLGQALPQVISGLYFVLNHEKSHVLPSQGFR